MSLEVAAGAALEKVKELLPHIESSEDTVDRAAERIEDAVRELEQHWEALADYARGFDERAQRRSHANAALQMALAESMEDLSRQLVEVRDEIGAEHGETMDALRELGDEAEEARQELEALMDRAQEEAERLAARMRALDQRFEQAVAALARFVEDDVEPALERMGDAIEERAEQLLAVLEEVTELAAKSSGTLLGGMFRLASEAKGASTAAAQMLRASAQDAVGQTADRLAEAADEVAEGWQAQAEAALVDLERALEHGAEQVDETRATVEGAGHETGEGLNGVIEGVSAALEFFSRFTFV